MFCELSVCKSDGGRSWVIFDIISYEVIYKHLLKGSLDVNANWAVRMSGDVRVGWAVKMGCAVRVGWAVMVSEADG